MRQFLEETTVGELCHAIMKFEGIGFIDLNGINVGFLTEPYIQGDGSMCQTFEGTLIGEDGEDEVWEYEWCCDSREVTSKCK